MFCEVPIQSPIHFFLFCFHYFLLICGSSLHILHTSFMSVIFVEISFPNPSLSLYLLNGDFDEQNIVKFIIISFIKSYVLSKISQNSCYGLILLNCLLNIFLNFIFRSFSIQKIVFAYGMGYKSKLIFFTHGNPILFPLK